MAILATVHVEAVPDDPELADNVLLKADALSLAGVPENSDVQIVALPEATGPVQIIPLAPAPTGFQVLLIVPVA